MKASRAIVGWVLITLFVAGGTELMAYMAITFGLKPRVPDLFFSPPDQVDQEKYNDYLNRRDPVLGWPVLAERNEPRDSPAFPAAANFCVTLYGDSFTYGDEVDDEHAWGNLLAQRLGCAVGNYGVGGYGTDQALLRFQLNKSDTASLTIMGIFPENIRRIVNRYRLLLVGGGPYGFKPRFVLHGGKLLYLPPKRIEYIHLSALFDNPAAFLDNELFLPDTDHGPVVVRFPFTFTLARLLSHEAILNWISGMPSWSSLWMTDHGSGALELMTNITQAFVAECKSRSKACLLVIFPTAKSYENFLETDTTPMDAFVGATRALDLEVLDLTSPLADRLERGSICRVLTSANCTGHFNEEGNRMIAEIVFSFAHRSRLVAR